MSTLVLCDEPAPRVVCPEAFQVAVSNWINSSNVGDGGPRLPPPAGLRLRWNCPFLSSPTPAYPTVFEVQRSQPFELAAMFVPSPTVGIASPRCAAAAMEALAKVEPDGVYRRSWWLRPRPGGLADDRRQCAASQSLADRNRRTHRGQ